MDLPSPLKLHGKCCSGTWGNGNDRHGGRAEKQILNLGLPQTKVPGKLLVLVLAHSATPSDTLVLVCHLRIV